MRTSPNVVQRQQKMENPVDISVMVLAAYHNHQANEDILLDKGWGNPDRNVVLKTTGCW